MTWSDKGLDQKLEDSKTAESPVDKDFFGINVKTSWSIESDLEGDMSEQAVRAVEKAKLELRVHPIAFGQKMLDTEGAELIREILGPKLS